MFQLAALAALSVTICGCQMRCHSGLSIAVESGDGNHVLGKFSGKRVSGFNLHPLIADRMGHRPDSPLESPWKRLRVHDDVKVSGKFVSK